MAEGTLGSFIRTFIQRVVNEHDLSAIDDLVSAQYRGTGPDWQRLAPDTDGLREFYRRQGAQRPDWRIDIQETIEVGDHVAVRAYAYGTEAYDDNGVPRRPPFPTAVEWLATYHVEGGKIREGRMIAWVVTSESR
jgi:hypothetical protein